jgi:hypothetical protein
VNQDCKDHPGPQDSRVLLVLLGVTELMAAMVLMAWAALLVLSGLLVAAVTRAHKGLPDPQAPLVRRGPPGYQVRRGSRAHHARRDSTSQR